MTGLCLRKETPNTGPFMRCLFALLTLLYGNLVCQVGITTKDACKKLSRPVVKISNGRGLHGTGFIISADGYILTANRLVFDGATGQSDQVVRVVLPDGSDVAAHQVLPTDTNFVGKDFTLLKVDKADLKLPYLELGSELEVDPGSQLTIIGFPFNALSFPRQENVREKFSSLRPLQPSWVKMYQLPKLVIGILTARLSGVSQSLDTASKQIDQPTAGRIEVSGVNLAGTVSAGRTVARNEAWVILIVAHT